jgi:hypothetical protein
MQMAVSVKANKLWRSRIACKPGALTEISLPLVPIFSSFGTAATLGKRAVAAKKSSKKK